MQTPSDIGTGCSESRLVDDNVIQHTRKDSKGKNGPLKSRARPACLHCRLGKTMCGGENEVCARCQKRNFQCFRWRQDALRLDVSLQGGYEQFDIWLLHLTEQKDRDVADSVPLFTELFERSTTNREFCPMDHYIANFVKQIPKIPSLLPLDLFQVSTSLKAELCVGYFRFLSIQPQLAVVRRRTSFSDRNLAKISAFLFRESLQRFLGLWEYLVDILQRFTANRRVPGLDVIVALAVISHVEEIAGTRSYIVHDNPLVNEWNKFHSIIAYLTDHTRRLGRVILESNALYGKSISEPNALPDERVSEQILDSIRASLRDSVIQPVSEVFSNTNSCLDSLGLQLPSEKDDPAFVYLIDVVFQELLSSDGFSLQAYSRTPDEFKGNTDEDHMKQGSIGAYDSNSAATAVLSVGPGRISEENNPRTLGQETNTTMAPPGNQQIGAAVFHRQQSDWSPSAADRQSASSCPRYHLLSWKQIHRIFRPPLPDGYTRIEWLCSCNKLLYADFDKSRLDEVRRLQQFLGRRRGVNDANDLAPSLMNDASQRVDLSSSLSTQVQGDSSKWSSNYTPSSSSKPPTTTLAASTPSSSTEYSQPAKGFWLGLCISLDRELYSRRYIALSELDLSPVKSDKELFLRLAGKYMSARKTKWYHKALVKLSRIELVQFQLWCKLQGYVSILPTPPNSVMPGGSDTNYSCTWNKSNPPEISDAFIHYISHQDEELSRFAPCLWLSVLPKRREFPFLLYGKELDNGFGLRFIDWPNALVIFSVYLLIVGAGIISGFAWWVARDDVQGGTGITAVVIALPPIILGSFTLRGALSA